MQKLQLKNFIIPLAVASLFLMSSYLSDVFITQLQNYIGAQGTRGMVLYVALVVLAIVIPFGTSIPIVPLSVAFWGGLVAALLNIAGWTIGAIATFFIARRFRDALMARVSILKQIERYGRMIPEENLFLTVIALRLGPPVDFVSYAIALFTEMRFLPYISASFIGMSAFAFFLSYASLASFRYQLLFIVAVLLAALVGYAWMREKRRR